MASAVDLHSHTTASDGTLSPRELVRMAARHGVRVLAITDHDCTGGVADAMDEARSLPPLEVVPGLEINCDVPGAEVHVLGYCVDWEAPWFQEFLGAQREERRQRIHRIAARLTELGMPIDPEDVFALVREGSAGRPHVAQAMVDVALAILAGILTGFTVLQYADVRAAYSDEVAGRALAVFTMAVFLGVALMQWLTGLAASLAAARGIDPLLTAFLGIAALLAAATGGFALLPWPRPMRENYFPAE